MGQGRSRVSLDPGGSSPARAGVLGRVSPTCRRIGVSGFKPTLVCDGDPRRLMQPGGGGLGPLQSCEPASSGREERGAGLPMEEAISTSLSVGTHLGTGPGICPSRRPLGKGPPYAPPPETVQG